jgi:hypothetical protein
MLCAKHRVGPRHTHLQRERGRRASGGGQHAGAKQGKCQGARDAPGQAGPRGKPGPPVAEGWEPPERATRGTLEAQLVVGKVGA